MWSRGPGISPRKYPDRRDRHPVDPVLPDPVPGRQVLPGQSLAAPDRETPGSSSRAGADYGSRPWDTIRAAADPNDLALETALRQLSTAVSQVTDAGTTAQKEQAERLLARTRRQVYLLLADALPEPETGASERRPEPGK